jgi:hypothetical protein
MPAFFAALRSKVIVLSHPAAAAERSIRQSEESKGFAMFGCASP